MNATVALTIAGGTEIEIAATTVVRTAGIALETRDAGDRTGAITATMAIAAGGEPASGILTTGTIAT
jgi:hypothetical protein